MKQIDIADLDCIYLSYDEPNKVIFEGSYGEFFDFCREKVES